MKKNILLTGMLIIAAFISCEAQTYVADKVISLPGEGGYDYLAIDKVNRNLYVSHSTSLNVVDLTTEQPVGVIDSMKGVHGIAIVNKLNRGFISDGGANTVVVFNLKTFKVIKKIVLEKAEGPDAIMYDPYSNKVFTFNGESNNSSVIDPATLMQVGTMPLGGAPEFAVADGRGKIYNNLEDKSSLNVIDSKSFKVIKNYPLAPCGGPTGLALDAVHQRLFTVCRENKGVSVVDINTGNVVATLPIGAGVDAVAYDPETQLIFCSCGDGTTTIIKQKSANDYSIIQTLKTGMGARTMTLDAKTHKIYLSIASFIPQTRKTLPGTFKVLVFKLQ